MNQWRKIKSAVCEAFGVSCREFTGPRKEAHVTEARHAAILLMMQSTRMSAKSLGDRLKVHHKTIGNSVQRAKDLIDIDADYKARFEKAATNLRTSGE